ncbi:MFS transporter [Hyphomonas johnsonii]|uniref:Major facilitator superfamily protein n=1 Tax=Hyphomonas johnsonii MHS-2 TaxID=1280950 RepID=A0A059FTC3_9PROT|nr:MFS transporter [Hyphomonas johnsonii]KCZ93919.1 major facilitator superfamily protein [Hyphomonas johnsonii MHS-2]
MSQSDAAPDIPRSAFSVSIFRQMWIASLASNFGRLVQAVGAGWLMTTLSTSKQDVALVQASTALPIMLFSLWAGALADSRDRRLVMLWAQVFMMVASLGLAYFAWAGLLTPLLLLAFTFLIGCGSAFYSPAWQASVGDMVPRKLLPGAIAYNSMGFNVARSVGPAIGGAIVAAAGAAAAFLLNAISYLGLIVVLIRWKRPVETRTLPREGTLSAISAGLRYAAMSPHIRAVLLRSIILVPAATGVSALMPIIAVDLIGGGAIIYGTLLGAFGFGAITGAFAMGRLRKSQTTNRIILIATLALALGTAATGLSRSLWFTLPALFLTGAGWVLALASFNVAVQIAAPRWVVARSVAVYQMVAFGGMVAGSSLLGWLADWAGAGPALLTASAVQGVGLLAAFALPLPGAENLDLDPLDRWQEPETAVPVESRSGPVVIAIDYMIAEDRIPAFMAEMIERRRMCRRDGARGWTLLRDLSDPRVWTERYQFPTWLDYVRSSQRRTKEDGLVTARLRDLLLPGHPPRIHRMLERHPTGDVTLHARTFHEPAASMTDPTRGN